ncbi:hypothetical protein [Halobacillus sp. A5]|uniref:hypothetical protein n=1 Tax=Halobacillus sp. A5 TaxID=2880263 RepID=UPI0020A68CC5|nr:hypothetical protein [Halobacillus sp. A5]MCP3029634.1 hypothetical protein [Halobacillus sp. A5]
MKERIKHEQVPHRTKFILKMVIPVAAIHYRAMGADMHKKAKWNKVKLEHDQRTRANAHFAGYITYWMVIVSLFTGSVLVQP